METAPGLKAWFKNKGFEGEMEMEMMEREKEKETERGARWVCRTFSRSLWPFALPNACSCESKYLETRAWGTIRQW